MGGLSSSQYDGISVCSSRPFKSFVDVKSSQSVFVVSLLCRNVFEGKERGGVLLEF